MESGVGTELILKEIHGMALMIRGQWKSYPISLKSDAPSLELDPIPF